MKKIMLFGFVMSFLMGANFAFADPEQQNNKQDETLAALTTKGYVDAGLKEVWKRAKQADVGNANTATYNSETNYTAGTVGAAIKAIEGDLDNVAGAVDDLKDQVDSLTTGIEYESGVGITVDNDTHTVGLDIEGNLENKTYVLKNGQWQELEVVKEWNSGILDKD